MHRSFPGTGCLCEQGRGCCSCVPYCPRFSSGVPARVSLSRPSRLHPSPRQGGWESPRSTHLPRCIPCLPLPPKSPKHFLHFGEVSPCKGHLQQVANLCPHSFTSFPGDCTETHRQGGCGSLPPSWSCEVRKWQERSRDSLPGGCAGLCRCDNKAASEYCSRCRRAVRVCESQRDIQVFIPLTCE